ncbi:MAG: FRG domain-containing protein, partial [Planctomycetota bacterium]
KFYQDLFRSRKQWIFRGHRNSDWLLQTTLERAVMRFGIGNRALPKTKKRRYKVYREIMRKGLIGRNTRKRVPVPRIEAGLLREFKRKCHHYTQQTPDENCMVEWFALMQHYGAPTRLLDCTYSFFASIYFALEDAEGEGECAVWAFNSDWMSKTIELHNKRMHDLLYRAPQAHTDEFEKALWVEPPSTLVYPLNPHRLNDRLVIQQGVFLAPGDVSKPFEDNMAPLVSGRDSKGNLFKLRINARPAEMKKILQHLRRMNMNSATLFPGLQGYAQSLKTSLVRAEILQPDPHVTNVGP